MTSAGVKSMGERSSTKRTVRRLVWAAWRHRRLCRVERTDSYTANRKLDTRPSIVDGISVVALAVGRGNTLYIGPRDRIVYALDATDGAVKWTFKPRHTVFASRGPRRRHLRRLIRRQHLLPRSDRRRLRWTFSTGKGRWGENPVHALAVGRESVVYAGVGTSVEAIQVVSSRK